ncbi:MAG TPA: hypothetical protein VJM51_04705 [Dehalococcoidia bacterium]|nr:hypothetical protein [Dehalococcoidia bacterium]
METIDWAKYQAVRKTTSYPTVFDEKRFTIQQLREAASRAEVLFRGWPFIYYNYDPDATHIIGDGLETVVNQESRKAEPIIEQWNLLRSGAFLHRVVMRELHDPRAKGERVLNPIETMYHVAEAISSLWRLYEALAVPGEEAVTIEFVYEDTKERELKVLDPSRLPLHRRSLCYATQVEVSRTLPLQIWRASDAQITAEICVEIFPQFQWEPSLRQIEDEIRPFLGRLAPSSIR